MSLKVFVSYAKEDVAYALKYYELLVQEGTLPWMDIKQLLPGQNWEAEIEKAFSDANVIFLLISKQSVNKRGFVQREANDAIKRLSFKKPTDIYVIPLLIEPCDVPVYIATRIQYININAEGSWELVRASLKLAAEQQSIDLSLGVNAGPFRVFIEKFNDEWKGKPGHDIKIEFPRFESVSRSDLAKELTLFFGGRASKVLIESRQKPWDQSPELLPGTDGFYKMDGRWDAFGITHATENLLSLTYEVGWYCAGAAHPNYFFETYNFMLHERLHVFKLSDFFCDEAAALKCISELCVDGLCRDYWVRTGEKPDDAQLTWFKNGTGYNFDNFAAFTIGSSHFTFLFAPYQVSAYAFGRWSVEVPFYDLLNVMRPTVLHLFGAKQM